MRKFFKMGLAICMVLVLLCSLAACSGGRGSGENSGGIGDGSGSGDIGSADVGDEGGIGADDNDSGKQGRKLNGKYEYAVAGKTIYLDVDVDKYIFKENGREYFKFTEMAEDYGFVLDDSPERVMWEPLASFESGSTTMIVGFADAGTFDENDHTFTAQKVYVACRENGNLVGNDTMGKSTERDPAVSKYRVDESRNLRVCYDLIVLLAYSFEGAKESLSDFSFGPEFMDYSLRPGNYAIP